MSHTRHLQDSIRYTFVRPIAEGGMGCVYEATQEGAHHFAKRVAIKLIREEYSNEPAFRKNFVGEAQLVADLIHNCIVQTYHLGRALDQYYMVMEYVDGMNLEEFILQHRALGEDIPVDLAAFIISRVCRGLAYAHRALDHRGNLLNIVHRDINPRNIMISIEGDVKVTDFGIAKAINLMYNVEGEILAGKDEYISPEGAAREITDERSDLFSCGVVLAELICGYNIFEVEGKPRETRRQITHMPLPDFQEIREGLSGELTNILTQSLQRNPSDRYQHADLMLNALEEALYSHGYGPTSEKLSLYIKHLFADGKAYDDDLRHGSKSFGLSISDPNNAFKKPTST